MTTETADPFEQAVMEAADEYAKACASDDDHPWGYAFSIVSSIALKERLRLHIQLALAKARWGGICAVPCRHRYAKSPLRPTCFHEPKMLGPCMRCIVLQSTEQEIAALEARLQED